MDTPLPIAAAVMPMTGPLARPPAITTFAVLALVVAIVGLVVASLSFLPEPAAPAQRSFSGERQTHHPDPVGQWLSLANVVVDIALYLSLLIASVCAFRMPWWVPRVWMWYSLVSILVAIALIAISLLFPIVFSIAYGTRASAGN